MTGTSVLINTTIDSPMAILLQPLQAKRAASKTIDDSQALNLGPKAAEGEHVFGVAHIFASFNDTFVVRFLRFADRQALAHVLTLYSLSFLFFFLSSPHPARDRPVGARDALPRDGRHEGEG
jgi:hypothetical protein